MITQAFHMAAALTAPDSSVVERLWRDCRRLLMIRSEMNHMRRSPFLDEHPSNDIEDHLQNILPQEKWAPAPGTPAAKGLYWAAYELMRMSWGRTSYRFRQYMPTLRREEDMEAGLEYLLTHQPEFSDLVTWMETEVRAKMEMVVNPPNWKRAAHYLRPLARTCERDYFNDWEKNPAIYLWTLNEFRAKLIQQGWALSLKPIEEAGLRISFGGGGQSRHQDGLQSRDDLTQALETFLAYALKKAAMMENNYGAEQAFASLLGGQSLRSHSANMGSISVSWGDRTVESFLTPAQAILLQKHEAAFTKAITRQMDAENNFLFDSGYCYYNADLYRFRECEIR